MGENPAQMSVDRKPAYVINREKNTMQISFRLTRIDENGTKSSKDQQKTTNTK